MITKGMPTNLFCIFFPLGDSRCWMFAGAHGLKATCYLWDQWEDSLLSYTGSPNFIYKNRINKSKGGVAMYIKNTHNYKFRDDLSVFHEGEFETIFAEVYDENQKSTFFAEIYRVPGTNEQLSISRYEEILSKYKNTNHTELTNTNIPQTSLTCTYHMDFLPTITRPTRITHTSQTLIDNIYIQT